MSKFRVTYQELCRDDKLTFVQFCDFEAENEVHAISQLLDSYKDYSSLVVSGIETVFKLST
jgi:hypothetical protein